MTVATAKRIAVIGGMTIDDIVLSDGTVHRRVPGGNALYSALGARLWGVASEVISFVGEDYDSDVLSRLGGLDIGTAYVARLDSPSIRLWVLYEEDGRRQIHLQHGSASLAPLGHIAVTALKSLLSRNPPEGAHIAALPVQVQRPVADVLTAGGVSFTLDSLEARGSVGGDLADYVSGRDLAPVAFLPSREEFALLFGNGDSAAFRAWATVTSTPILVLKDGEHGSLVSEPPTAEAIRVPAFESTVVDPTGAGDAYCGGFSAGVALGRPAIDCALMGTVSASFVVEQVGAGALFDATTVEVEQRRELLQLAMSHEEL